MRGVMIVAIALAAVVGGAVWCASRSSSAASGRRVDAPAWNPSAADGAGAPSTATTIAPPADPATLPAAPFADAAAPGTLRIRVVAADGVTAVAGARVEVYLEEADAHDAPPGVWRELDVPAWSGVADREGRAAWETPPAARVRVAATHGRARGEASFDLRTDAGAQRTVVLRPAVEVVAVRASGAPAAGLALTGATTDAAARPRRLGVTGPDGRAIVTPPGEGAAWTLGAEVAGAESESVSRRVEPSATTAALTLPPAGRLTIRAVAPGGAVAADGRSMFALERAPGRTTPPDSAAYDGWRLAAFGELRAGVAVLPYVAAGGVFRARVVSAEERRRPGTAVGFGPTQDAASATLDVPCCGPSLLATGRLRYDDGNSVEAREAFFAAVPATTSDGTVFGDEVWTQATLGPDGAFRATLDAGLEPPFPVAVRLFAGSGAVGDDGSIRREIPAPAPRDGVVDLGDVVFPRSVRLCAGTVVDPEGTPVAGAGVEIVRPFSDGWRTYLRVRAATTDAQGRFDLRVGRETAAQVPPEARVGVAAGSCFGDGPQPFARGADDVRLIARPAGALAGSYVLASTPGDAARDRSAYTAFEVWLVGPPATPRLPWEGLQGDRLQVQTTGELFFMDGLAPGVARIEFLRPGAEAPTHVVDGVVIRAGETCRDPRLQDVDLSASFAVRTVIVKDETGRPIPGARVHLLADAGWLPAFVAGRDGRATVVIDRARVDAPPAGCVTAAGRIGVELGPLAEDRTVVLSAAAARRVTVRLPRDAPVSKIRTRSGFRCGGSARRRASREPGTPRIRSTASATRRGASGRTGAS
ncbi:MAG TPA: hypothetical protein VEI02_01535 [Planctomycetota bacterium]|nr:hypothetical protein [Planctomycetota bacterium]